MTTKKQLQKQLDQKQMEHQLASIEANDTRAQSIAIGNAGGGAVEISMRSVRNVYLWNVYQPVEVIELINQLAAGIGCHIHIQPREDFGSWRNWQVSEEELERFRGPQRFPGVGWAPHAKYERGETRQKGALAAPDESLKLNLEDTKEKEHVATKKAVNKRSPKRRRASSK